MWYSSANNNNTLAEAVGSAFTIAVQLLYLIAVVFLATAYAAQSGDSGEFRQLLGLPATSPLPDIIELSMQSMVNSIQGLGIPFYAVVCGFVGAIAWCLYVAAKWTSKGLFNNYYILWYLTLPFVGAMLGAAAAMLILAGLSVITVPNPEGGEIPSLSFAARMTLCLTSFVAGYSARYIWKQLDKGVRSVLRVGSDTQEIQDSVEKGLVDFAAEGQP